MEEDECEDGFWSSTQGGWAFQLVKAEWCVTEGEEGAMGRRRAHLTFRKKHQYKELLPWLSFYAAQHSLPLPLFCESSSRIYIMHVNASCALRGLARCWDRWSQGRPGGSREVEEWETQRENNSMWIQSPKSSPVSCVTPGESLPPVTGALTWQAPARSLFKRHERTKRHTRYVGPCNQTCQRKVTNIATTSWGSGIFTKLSYKWKNVIWVRLWKYSHLLIKAE